MTAINRNYNGRLMRQLTREELEVLLESDDIDTVQAAEAELKRRDDSETWCEYWDVD